MDTKPNSQSKQGSPINGIPGVVEWIMTNGGTVSQFNAHVLTCKVLGLNCRYFVTEGWVGVKTDTCPPGKAVECRTLAEFISVIQAHSAKFKPQAFAAQLS